MRTEAEIKERIKVIEDHCDKLEADIELNRNSVRVLGADSVAAYVAAYRRQVCELKWAMEPEGYNPHGQRSD
jgi:hypothetical protein